MLRLSKINFLFLTLILLLFFAACAPTKKLKKDEYLLVKNKVVADKKEVPTKTEISYLVRPTANKKFLNLFLWKVGIYQSMLPADTSKDNKAKRWFRERLGEPPVLLDSSLIDYSMSQIQLYMHNNGYFHASVDYNVKIKKKKAKVTYQIVSGDYYKIEKIDYQIEDNNLAEIILSDTNRRLFKTGDRYDEDVFSEERTRITKKMRNLGYYGFIENHISFIIDSNLNRNAVNVTLQIRKEEYEIDGKIVKVNHRKYFIKEIEINTYPGEDEKEKEDTTVFFTEVVRKKDTNHYTLHYYNGFDYKPKSLTHPLWFSLNDLYTADGGQSTYNRFVDMQNFGSVRVFFEETEDSKQHIFSDTGHLNLKVHLVKLKRNHISFDLLGKNIGGDFGFGVSMNYKNRNTFRAGEIFSINVMYANEFQNIGKGSWRFRNFELGGDIGLTFPKLLFPIKQQNIAKRFRMKSSIIAGGNYQRQDHYSRFILSAGFNYEWKSSVRMTHTLSLINFNMVKIYPDSVFNNAISHLSQRIREKYIDHLLIGSGYKFIFNSLKTAKRDNFYLIQFNANFYGNLLYAIFSLTKAEKNENNQYLIWGIPFASYLSVNLDFAYNLMVGKKSSLVFHADLGVGVPTLNSRSLPFEKSFYLGGSNSMRAWRLRTIGPGSYKSSASALESTGDLKLELNVEFRTPLYRFLHGALFVDAGNIWNFKKNEDIPNGEFAWNRFYKEIAIGAGLGLRLDFSFFVLRLDASLPLYNPALDEGKRWVDRTVSLRDFILCFGIGYPF